MGNPSKNRFTPINSRSIFLYVKSDTIFWFPSAELWDKSGQNYDFSSYLKGLKIGSKLWVYRRITKNYGFEHPPIRTRVAAHFSPKKLFERPQETLFLTESEM